VRGSPAGREREDLLSSVPGIRPTIARTLIAELPELGTLSAAKRSPRSPGLPRGRGNPDDGQGKSFIGGGRSFVRAAMCMGALVAARHNPALQAFRCKTLDLIHRSMPDFAIHRTGQA